MLNRDIRRVRALALERATGIHLYPTIPFYPILHHQQWLARRQFYVLDEKRRTETPDPGAARRETETTNLSDEDEEEETAERAEEDEDEPEWPWIR